MRKSLIAMLAVALLSPCLARAQESAPIRTVYSSDSLVVGWPTVSPDGRWLVFIRTLSNQESRLMIRPVAGGEARELFAEKGTHQEPVFTRQGDRLVFTSSIPRRAPNDAQMYIVAATFDTRTGTLTSSPRQISLDPVRLGGRTRLAISPDGQSIAYVASPGNQLRVIPIVGGNARTLAEPSGGDYLYVPGWLAWSADGAFVSYHVREGDISTRYRVARGGGKRTVVARVEGGMGPLSPDGQHYFVVEGRVPATIRFFTVDGREVASARVRRMNHLVFSPDGRYLVGRSDNTRATLMLAPVAGGPARSLGTGGGYDWGVGWSSDGRVVHVAEEDSQGQWLRVVSVDGSTKSRVRLPENIQFMGVQADHIVFREGPSGRSSGWKLIAQRMSNGARTVLAENVQGFGCCTITPAGGMYYGFTGDEFHFLQLRGDRLEVRAMRIGAPARLLADLPRRLLGSAGFAVAGEKLAYTEVVGDSTRVHLISRRGSPAVTLATFPRTPGVGEFAFSHDGRMLMIYTNDLGQPMTIFRLDESGKLAGAPQTFTLPFEYYYEVFWLRDGSGLTMIAQPRGAPNAEVALVKLADPQQPIFLSKGDPGSKWGHLLSHDGKYVAYPAERERGSSIQMLDVAAVLKRATAQR